MIQKILISWLIITILGYGLALSIDVHNVKVPDVAVGIDIHNIGDHSDHQDSDTAKNHNHCSHGSSHLLGLNFDSLFNLPIDKSIYLARHSISLVTSPSSRLLRPPRLV